MSGISAPSVVWNNETVYIIPNTLKFKTGKGERNVRAASGGGSSVQMVVTTNVETKKSMVSFEMMNTKANFETVQKNVDLFDQNAVELVDPQSGFATAISNLTVINDPEMSLSQDGNITVEMEGAPVA